MMVRADFEAIRHERPLLTDEFIGRFALQRPQSPDAVVSQENGVQVLLEFPG
jgi:hypothetical protein